MPLSREEWFSFFLLPFITPKPHWRSDHYSQSETDRFKKYGFDKKLKEAEKVQIFGTLFWLFMIIIGAIVFSEFL
jgi:deoxyribodipyrimidine photolyase-like uncharacterized protein